METTGTPTPEELLDAGRRTIDRKALQKTIKDIFSYRNPLRQSWKATVSMSSVGAPPT